MAPTTHAKSDSLPVKLIVSATVVLALSLSADAAIVVNANEAGSDVVFDYSGSVNTAGLSPFNTGSSLPAGVGTEPPTYWIRIGPTGSAQQIYTGMTSIPGFFGAGGYTNASSSTGDVFSLTNFFNGAMVVPLGYTSGAPLSGTMTFLGHSISSLNLTPGAYTWTWGSGGDADSATLNIIPEPATLGLLALGGLALLRRRP